MAKSDGEALHYTLGLSVSLAIGDGVGLRLSGRTAGADIVEEIYFDTDRRDLARRGFLLRCRPGDSRTGWQLLRADARGTAVLTAPLNHDATTPQPITDRTFGLRAGRDLVEVGRLRAEHTSHELVDGRDRLVCRLTDSVFTSTAAVDASLSAQQWRTVSLHPTADPGSAVLSRLDRRLRNAGAKPAAPVSGPTPAIDLAEGVRRDIVGDYVVAQRAAILLGDVRLRPAGDGQGRTLGESEEADIHDTRVAVRRLRSTLRNYPRAFDPRLSRELELELAWYASALGQVRDQHVLLDRLLAALAEVPAELVLGPVAATISEHLLLQTAEYRRALHEALGSSRYLALLDSVDALVRGLAASKPLNARQVRTGLAKAEGRLARRLAEARDQLGTPTADIASHTARKAAKRARYAAELATPVLNRKDAKATIKRLRRLQDALGRHQDGVVAAELLRRLGAGAAQPGQNGFTFGLLHEREQAALRADRDAFQR